MKTLDPISLPLNKVALIEASAGTGKTYTMVNLYLRLLLGVGCSPLNVEQILVVTFTRAATQELRDRIRVKVAEVSKYFQEYSEKGKCEALTSDDFLWEIYQNIEHQLAVALLRLRIAEQEIDVASIFTIDSFCQKMLSSFAFDSGMRFDIELQPDETELLTGLSEEVWRELFYSCSELEADFILKNLYSPQDILKKIRSQLYKDLPELSESQQASLTTDFGNTLLKHHSFLNEVKQYWRENKQEVTQLIYNDLDKGTKKSLNGRSYQVRYVNSWITELEQWANTSQINIPECFNRFCQNYINEKTAKGKDPLYSEIFVKNDKYLTAYQQEFERLIQQQKIILELKFLLALRQKLAEYKRTHKERNFSDFTNELNLALQSEKGQKLATQIRQRYPFAMIDEFQDTNLAQYQVFNAIFIDQKSENQGFIMIGDPKQSIYKFRGADIFTYLKASKQAQEQATLNKNWRSQPTIVCETNQLFDLKNELSPFIYQDILFQSVEFDDKKQQVIGQDSIHYFLLDNKFVESQRKGKERFDTLYAQASAEHCASEIQQQLKLAQQGELFLQKEQNKLPLKPQDIAILVRNGKEAKLIQEALKERNIQSVFLSEKHSVYNSEEAQQVLWLLNACLHFNNQKAILTSLGTSLWQLNASEIFELKNNEIKWDRWLEKFAHYNEIWLKQGVLPMLHHIFISENLIAKLRNSDNGDRKITNLLHLAELLQNAMPSLENETALVRWYEMQLDNAEDNQEEQVLRLETEQKLIKIITFHGSKGLEYPIVWLPFVGKTTNFKLGQVYRDQNNQQQWVFGDYSDEIKNAIAKEEFAEDLRLIYVAITRAVFQINFILPQQFKATNSWNAMAYLLSNGEIGETTSNLELLPTKTLLEKKQLTGKIVNLDKNPTACDWSPSEENYQNLCAKTFTQKIKRDGQLTSFSALHSYHQWQEEKHSELVQDYDYQNAAITPNEEIQSLYSPFTFPHSTKVGTILHSFFEHCDFTQPINNEKVAILCEQLHLEENWIEPTTQWFEQVLTTPIIENEFCLKDIPNSQRLNELQFYLNLKNSNALPKLNELIKKHAKLKELPSLSLPKLNGFVRGFIDCIVKVDGKFYILDYKSNFLGNFAEDYSIQNLEKVMGQYRYDLQYLLYTLAVHRYLRSRIENYDYEKDFGGVGYLFLRAMEGSSQNGVFFDKPSKKLIEKMDLLFG
ncbi:MULTISPECIES: exodeoxyribonuclease V subunit beta [Pasteurellaceae]|uniref:RecBCD enzyme subunit RecB n=1 Tax=Pasteurella atlantica TaxID=2827233 RepID=A0AAW8CJ13_9PAST|nr:exodeoxyribonuclease V subunit beta [Pasteurella atlantica]MBR0572847.1 exodeoxyribonuclease V subunit beta [Pasteurella atlantica]MDP8038776.1 exodeoxyribonuclease V subunit beta [Pasteurella atlantica]MDP8040867.1 exodeoxyribonuclease V subunit beta [Pasteurella atlantica]MDP8042959.1 exodeoxyribonuclease V subunit beta [Pasteurella atlantica]MDP8045046.1 exodeoxyribonuclease V subunit beta [Pasteurella atlantica]